MQSDIRNAKKTPTDKPTYHSTAYLDCFTVFINFPNARGQRSLWPTESYLGNWKARMRTEGWCSRVRMMSDIFWAPTTPVTHQTAHLFHQNIHLVFYGTSLLAMHLHSKQNGIFKMSSSLFRLLYTTWAYLIMLVLLVRPSSVFLCDLRGGMKVARRQL